MIKKELGKLAEFFTDKQNIEIKRELLSAIKTKTAGVNEMSEEKLDKTVKIIRYTLQLYDLSSDMSNKIKQIEQEI
jgi:hypothetical protein